MASRQAPECCICLQPAQTRNGLEFLISPGCCGNWFHQRCLNDFIAQGGTECPLCKTGLPALAPVDPLTAAPAVPQAQPVAVAPPAPPSQHFQHTQRVIKFQQAPKPHKKTLWQRLTGMSSSLFDGATTEDRLDESYALSDKDATSEDLLNENNSDKKTKKTDQQKTDLKKDALKTERDLVSVSLTPEYGVESLAAKKDFHVRVSVEYQEREKNKEKGGKEDGDERTPLDVVCVLDNSGSMQGDKMDNLKKAIEFIISVLDERDRLSLITFNSTATLVLNLKRVTENMKERIRQSILPTIKAGGGTDILKGLQIGERVLHDRTTRNSSSVLFLLTDGQDRSNTPEKLALARNLRGNGENSTSLFVFGFGVDHDSKHMQEIADAGEGSFVFVETSDTVIDAFGGAIGAQQGAALRNMEISLSTVLPGSCVLSVQSGSYRNSVETRERERDTAIVCYPDLYVGERRDFVVSLSLPASETENAHTLIATANALFSIRQHGTSSERFLTQTSACHITRVSDISLSQYAAQRVRDVKVDAELFRLRTTAAISSAIQLADRGEIEDAQRILSEMKDALQRESVAFAQANPLALSLQRDLDDCMERMRSRQVYERAGGRAQMSEHLDNYSKQRRVYSKSAAPSVYQTSRSAAFQSSAAVKKSGFF